MLGTWVAFQCNLASLGSVARKLRGNDATPEDELRDKRMGAAPKIAGEKVSYRRTKR